MGLHLFACRKCISALGAAQDTYIPRCTPRDQCLFAWGYTSQNAGSIKVTMRLEAVYLSFLTLAGFTTTTPLGHLLIKDISNVPRQVILTLQAHTPAAYLHLKAHRSRSSKTPSTATTSLEPPFPSSSLFTSTNPSNVSLSSAQSSPPNKAYACSSPKKVTDGSIPSTILIK